MQGDSMLPNLYYLLISAKLENLNVLFKFPYIFISEIREEENVSQWYVNSLDRKDTQSE